MKKIALLTLLILMSFSLFSQHTLYQKRNVKLYYTASYKNTIKCDDGSYDQYKITLYLYNGSGKQIHVSKCDCDHVYYTNVNIEAKGCSKPFPLSATISIGNVKMDNGDELNDSYYLLVPCDDSVPDPRWSLSFE
jgi:uncharacterized protein YxeA